MKTKTRELFVNRKISNLTKGTAFNLTLVLLALLLASLTAAVAPAQDSPSRGAKVGNSYAVGDFETVNTTNGNLMLNFPLGSLPGGRAEVGAGINLIYNSKLYDSHVDKLLKPEPCTPDTEGSDGCRYFNKNVITQSDKGGWKYGMAYRLEFEDRRDRYRQHAQSLPNCRSLYGGHNDYWDTLTYVHKLRVVFPDGSTHEMIPDGHTSVLGDRFYNVDMNGTLENCGTYTTQTSPPIYYSIDGSYVRLESTSENDWTLYFSDGKKVVNSSTNPQRISDRNGNYVDVYGSQVTDQFGRSVTISRSWSLGEDEIRSKGVGGAEELVWKVKWKNIGVAKTYKACVGTESACPEEDWRSRLEETMSVVDTITQPEQLGGHSYTFSYNAPATIPAEPNTSTGWGEVSKIDLPTGAEVNYSYYMDGKIGGNYEWSLKEILRNYPESKTLKYDHQYDLATPTRTTETWYYGTSISAGGVTGPDGSTTTNYFGNTEQEGWRSGLTYKTVSSNGTMKENFWAFNCPYGCGSPGPVSGTNPYVKTEYTSIKDPSDTSNDYSLTAIKDYTYDKNGNVTQVKEYDWVPYGDVPRDSGGQVNGVMPTGVAPKRTTATGYVMQAPNAGTTTTNSYLYIWANNSTTKPTNLLHLPAWTIIRTGSETGTPVSRTEMTYDNSTTGGATDGNLTGTKAWDSAKAAYSSNPLTTGNSISTSATYNEFGMPTLTTDALGNKTQISYEAIPGPNSTSYTNLYPTKVVSAYDTSIAQTTQTEYDFYTGLPKKVTSLGNTTSENVSSETVYDAAGRPLISKAAVGIVGKEVWTQTSYDDTLRRIITKSDLFVKEDGKKVSIQHFDQIGRVRLSRMLENPATESATNEQHGIKVQTRYLTGNGNSYQLTSNPYRAATSGAASGEPSMGWTLSKSVNTGKHAETETFSGAGLPAAFGGSNTSSTGVVKTDVDLNRTLVTDQAGKQRISKTNALGQLMDVWEITASDSATVAVTFPSQSLSAGYQTTYSYDTLNNLTNVNQGSWQSISQTNRTFAYSSLSRLTSASNPESGAISYLYDNNGNLTQKTDARSVVTAYTYDELNRVTNRNYSAPTNLQNYQASQNVTYTYDNKTNARGRLTKVTNGFSTTEYTGFDILGRVTSSQQTTDNAAYPAMTYTYNLSGALIEEKYPSDRVVRNVLDAEGDLTIVQSKKNATAGYWNYADHFSYTAAGAVGSMQLGNNKWESTSFNSRLQPEQIALGTVQNGTDNLNLIFNYGTTANNGNVQSQTITVPTEVRNSVTYNAFTTTQNYTYDSLNRLQSATETIPNQTGWKQTFKYDRYGNRTFDEGGTSGNYATTTLTRSCTTSTYNPNGICDKKITNPKIAAGNNQIEQDQDGDSVNDYLFDVAGNTTKDAGNKTFTYDGENKQTKVQNGSTIIGEYFYDGDGKRVKKYVPSTGETTIFVYDADGKMVAEYSTIVVSSSAAKVSYLTNDHLGSPRITTDANGAVTSRRDFMPFGEEVVHDGYGTDTVRQKFTGYERDIESGLDFGKARYYSSKLGRFYSVDPENYGASEDDPQSWNGYSYARNNPIIFTDSEGLDVEYCDTNKVCVTLNDKEAKATLFNKDLQKSFGNTVKDGRVTDSNGNIIATYVNDNPFTMLGRSVSDNFDRKATVVGGLTAGVVVGTACIATGTCAAVAAAASRLLPRLLPRLAPAALLKLCFVAGTQVLTENGLKPIEEIREGDKVLSFNEKTKQTEYKTVVQTMVREAEAGRILSVKVEGEVEALGVTAEHPFYVRVHKARDNTASEDDEGEWIEAKDLRIGDEIRKADGTWAKVEFITQRNEGAKVYNFKVADNHNYFVGQTNLLAHNNNCFKTIGNALKNIRQISSGRLSGFTRGNTSLPGGDQAARETFRQLTGRYPSGSFDRVVTGGKEVMYRAASDAKSGVPKLDVVDTAQKTLEKISFTP